MPTRERCPDCSMRLWHKPIPRKVRFHDTRHTTATLLLKKGVPLATVQKLLRHSDPAITSEIYGHLDLEDMRAGINRLSFQPTAEANGEVIRLRVAAGQLEPALGKLAATVLTETESPKTEARDSTRISQENRGLPMVGATGFEPATTCTPSGPLNRPAVISGAQPTPTSRMITPSGELPFGPPEGDEVGFLAADLLMTAAPPGAFRALRGGAENLLTIAEVAKRLRVSRATVYALCERGDLPHLRIVNSIRVAPADLDQFIRGRKR